MAPFLNAQETIFRYGEYMEAFHDAFKSSEITFGSPDDFFALCEDLKTNIPLRAELAKLTRSVLDKENYKISVRTAITIIAIASGGPETTTSERNMSKPLNILIGFLTNAVGCRQIHPDRLDDMCLATRTSESVADQDSAATEQQLPSIPPPEMPGNNLPREPLNTAADSPVLDGLDDDPSATPPPASSEEVKELFTRLELNALEVKLHLDSIDQRISRIEPRLESVPARETPSPERVQRTSRHQTQQSYAAPFTATALAEPDPEPGELLLHGSELHRVPFESYDEPSPFFFSGAAVVLICILFGLASGAGAFLYHHRADRYPYHAYQYLQERLSALRQSHTAASGTAAPATAPTTNATQPNTNSTPATDAANVTPAPQPEPIPAVRAQAQPTPTPTATVEVSSSAMAANIISAPKPIYPKLAQQNNIQGHVILQATVSPDGTVQDVHGIKGPQMLQDAAVDAVSNWHYRPYLVNGRPMPVAMLVTIDFTLQPEARLSSAPHPPAPQQPAFELTPSP